MTRVLALDFGKARTGVALSDVSGEVARPLEPVLHANSSDGIASIARMISTYEVDRIVVGLPVGLDGRENQQAARTRSFVARLRSAVTVPVVLHDERYTTKLAERMAGDSQTSRDSLAACHLLQSYIEASN